MSNTENFPIRLTEGAVAKAAQLLEQADRDNLRLRVGCQPGGCAGLRYVLVFSEEYREGDLIENFGSLEVIIDNMSAPYLEGAIISFEDTLESQGFNITNPNANGTCACGDSFH